MKLSICASIRVKKQSSLRQLQLGQKVILKSMDEEIE